jgi:hypothetical protein
MNVAQRVLLAIQPGKYVVAKAAYYIFVKIKLPNHKKILLGKFLNYKINLYSS